MNKDSCSGLAVSYLRIETLTAYPKNARTHSLHQIRQIAASIKTFGFTTPVLIDRTNTIIAGHGRVAAGKLLGMKVVPTIRLENLTEAQIRAYVLADNRLAEKAGWDKSILAIELQNLLTIDGDFDVAVTGFEIPEIDLIIEDARDKQQQDRDDLFQIDETSQAVTQLGDLWQLGRLTLNVLLSFAQFERELTGERIRDKVAASKKKGMWMGGVVPLGYDCADHRLIVHQSEAETVCEIFRQYLRLGCVKKLKDYLDRKEIRSKSRTSSAGRTSGGKTFSRGALYHLLNNRVYIGEIVHQRQSYPGQHKAILPQRLWDQVAAQLEANNQAHRSK